jgi:ribonuclease HI
MLTSESNAVTLAEQMKLPEHAFLLIGDGSGQTLEHACGWHVNAFMRTKSGYKLREFQGGATSGTNNYAELMPYVHTLWHLWQSEKLHRGMTVIIVSDSEMTVRCGNGTYNRNSNRMLWAAIDEIVRMGVTLKWFHTKRNTNQFGTLSDEKAGEIRRLFEARK